MLVREHECRKHISVTLVTPVFPHSFHQEAHASHLTSTNIHSKVGDVTSLGNNCWFKWPVWLHPLVKVRGGGGRAEAPVPVHGHGQALSTPGPPPRLSILPPQGAYWPLPGVLSWVPNPDPAQAQRRVGRGSLGRMGPGRQCGPAAKAGFFLL